MKLDERRRADELDRYWDAMMRGETPPLPEGVDDVAVEVIARLAEHRATPGIDAARHRVRRQILAPAANADDKAIKGSTLPDTVVDSDTRAGLRQPVDLPWSARFRWLPNAIGMAAVLLLAVGLGYYVFGVGRSEHEGRNTIPAVVAPATPTPAITEQSLLEISIPSEALPQGESIGAGLAHVSIPEGTRSTWQPVCCAGLLIEYVVRGAYSVRAEDAIQIVHSDGSLEEIPAGTEVILGAGNSVISRNETVVEAANVGSGPVELVGWVLVELDGDFGGHSLPGQVMYNTDVQMDLVLEAQPATIRLSRLTLLPGSQLSPPAAGTFSFGVTLPMSADGTPVISHVSKEADGGFFNVGKQANEIYVLTFEQTGSVSVSPVAASPTP